MTKQELLKKYYDEACHNLLCYSTNYLMDKPRKGYEKEWKETKVEVELLEEMMKEKQVWRIVVNVDSTAFENLEKLKERMTALEVAVQEQSGLDERECAEKLVKNFEKYFEESLLNTLSLY